MHCWRRAVCVAVVNGLNNFRVGFPDALPTANTAVDVASYPVCGSLTVGVNVGKVVTVKCASSSVMYQYIIIQSVDTSAEKLCLAEVCVNEAGQCAVTSVF